MRLALQAEVRHGRLILDEPVDLPEGTKVELMPADDGDDLDEAERERLARAGHRMRPEAHGDDLDEAERERLHASLRRSAEQLARGEGTSAEDALRRLREP